MITLGSDPEFFLETPEGQVKSAIGIINGKKGRPIKTVHGAYHVDNVAAEVNSLPATTEDEFVCNVRKIIDLTEGMAKAKGFVFSKHQVAEFMLEDLMHPMAQEAGCEIDFNAYAEDPKRPNTPKTYQGLPFRVVGGHIHVGFAKEDKIDPIALLKTLDIFVTIPMLSCEDERRRHLYGQAGDFRWKKYGIEYRTPSNAWTFTVDRIRWVYQQVMTAIARHKENIVIPHIQDVINKHDLVEASNICVNLNIHPMR